MMNVAVIKGDGIGPEVISQAVRVLKAAGKKYGYVINFNEVQAGGAAIDAFGTCAPAITLETCKKSDAVLLGALGGPEWDNLDACERPEKCLLTLRKELGLYANIRPVVLFDCLKNMSPLKNENIKDGVDFVLFRELTSGIYFGRKEHTESYACDCMEYREFEIERIAHKAFASAMARCKKLTSIDKANVLHTSILWRKTVEKVSQNYPSVELKHLYVDNAAMQIIKNPSCFDVILTENMFGDILSDEAGMICGSIGMLPSASVGDKMFGLYEPAHGSAPELAGKNIANPIAAILSAALMLRYSFGLNDEAKSIEKAVEAALKEGFGTKDIAECENYLGTKELTDKIIYFI
jgi:3-isopropylmalate dehydrogenase